jgi:hypothetical protein
VTTLSIVQPGKGRIVRPPGVTGVAVLFAAAAFASFAFAALTALGRDPLSAGAFLVGGGMELAGPLVYVIFAALCAIASIGLSKMARWSRWLAIAIAAWGMWQGVMPISSAVIDFRLGALVREGVAFIVRGVIVWYLLQGETRDAFSTRAPQPVK